LEVTPMATTIRSLPAAPIELTNEVGNGKEDGLYQLHSLARAVSVLEMLGESDTPLSLSELCRLMNLHKSTAHRSLMVLEQSGLIERTPENRFRLGLKLYELGNRAVEQIDLRMRVRPYMARLSAQIGETVHLGVLQKSSIVYIDKAGPNRKVCTSSKSGTSNPVYCTSMGKAILAFLPEEEVEQVIANLKFVRYTENTLGTREDLLKSLEKVRRRGYAIDDEEIELGVRCIGAPVFNQDHRPIAAISVSGPTLRITVQSVPALAERLLRCSREISASLGSQPRKRSHHLSSLLRYSASQGPEV
jgi:DNA-binding IclR family transcriptional regulator